MSFFLKSMTLSKKLMVFAMVTSIVAMLIVSTAVYSFNTIAGFNKLYKDLEVITTVVADRSAAAIDFEDIQLASKNLQALDIKESIYLGCMYKEGGIFFAGHSTNGSNKKCPEYSEINNYKDRNTIVIVKPIMFAEKLGELAVFAHLKELNQQNQTLLIALFASTILAFVVSFFIANYLKNFVSGPIKTLRDTINKVQKSKDYSIRALRMNSDELGDLTDDLNGMLMKIETDNEALKRSERKFKSLSVSSPVGVFQSDAIGHIVYANNQWKKITNLAEDNMDKWGDNLHPDDVDNVTSAWQRAIEDKAHFDLEYRFISPDGNVTSVVCHARPLYSEQNDIYGYVGSLLDITDLKEAQFKLETLALYDPLTNVANRLLLKNRLTKAIQFAKREKKQIGLIFLDIDNFKRINDSLGHDVGDVLLTEVAGRIKSCVRETDTVARLGGDEFVVLIDRVKDIEGIGHIAEQLIATISKPIQIKRYELNITTSIGVTIGPKDGETVNTLMKNADLAMYSAKSLGKNMFQYYSKKLNKEMLYKITLEKELRAALDDGEFLVVYQPKYEFSSDKITGFEALLRWQSKTRGLVGPSEIIPVAEESGLINAIGDWVIKKACADTVRLVEAGSLPLNGRVAINLSVKQFRNARFLGEFIKIIKESKVSPKNIELEITETILMDEFAEVVPLLYEFKRLGVSITVDDFGTGYSSLSYIKQLPIDYIKVDKSFIDGLPTDNYDTEITAAIIAMSHKLGISVVAEGVETDLQLSFLNDNKCDYAQGFLFGEGETIEDIVNGY